MDGITSFFNWLFNLFGVPKSWFVYFSSGVGIRIIDLAAGPGAPTTWVPQTSAYAASFASAGNRFYAAFFNFNGSGNSAGVVSSYLGGTSFLFAGPITTNLVMTEPGAGLVTAGPHRFGYLIQTGNGFTTRPSPAPGNVFTPVNFTASGSHNLNMQIAAPWPNYASVVQAVMTTSANSNRYYTVPGASIGVPGGTFFTANIPINISDADLAATGTDVTSYLNLLTTDVSGNPPFLPYFLHLYSNRMGYTTLDPSGIPVTYYSDPNNYQSITASQHGIYLPGNLPQTCTTDLRGVAYIFGPHWTYAVSDNGKVPVQWASPQLVDGGIGTLAPRGVCTNTAQGFIWVADVGGLYLFRGGQYPQRPISYYQQPDWNQINWANAASLVVVDDAVKHIVSVYVPVGGVNPTFVFSWDYSEGTEPEQVKYSRNFLSGWSIGTAGVIQNPTTRRNEVWVTSASADRVLRENDGSEANPYRDVATGGGTAVISSSYQTSLLPGLDNPHGFLTMHHGDHLRISGQGQASIQANGLDGVTQGPAIPLQLSNTPGLLQLIKYFLQNEHATLTIATSSLDQFFVLTYIAHYWTQGAPQR